MMIASKKEFYGGIGLMIGFIIVLILFFSPLYNGKNGLDYLDNLYNSISKGSAYYIPKVKKEAAEFMGKPVAVTLSMENKKQAEETIPLFKASGAKAVLQGEQLKVTGNLGKILEHCLQDADDMYRNHGEKVSGRYGYDERRVLYNWWKVLKGMEKDLKNQKKFKEAKVLDVILSKAVESSYNYYKIEPQRIGDRWGIVLFSLIFYVIYTMWYGFAIMFMFEGWGLRLEH